MKFNDDKMEVMLLGSSHQLKKVTLSDIPIGAVSVTPSTAVRNLGVLQDASLTMSSHISKICSSAHLHLRNIARIRPYLSPHTTEQLVHAFISSKLDMGNALLYGLPATQIDRLQLIQNHAARLVTGTKKTAHITPILEQLHWLPVRLRIQYKILMQVFKALHDQGPIYIRDLLDKYTPMRTLRSGSDLLLVDPRTRTSFGDRAFSKAAPCLWNKLPASVRHSETLVIFKRRLKTHLFKTAF